MSLPFPRLNLPPAELRLEQNGDEFYVFDIIRKKMIFLTPEEWVRQHFLHLLINHLGYPKSLIKVESGLKYNHREKRSDLLVYDRSAKVFMLIECKSYKIEMGKATLHQLATYNKVLDADHVAITNGLRHFCWQKKEDRSTYDPLEDFPPFPGS
ncbi:MAG: type I restriction enzyme HsdR N-terminal domain-containing protein [Cytophagales bacterium]|nr:type I restriction enzyme HsdR N-terminal domain-containing protein [Cytophagales bacterium]